MVAQFTNFESTMPLCVGAGGTLPEDGVLVRLTVWTELEWEANLLIPTFDPILQPPRTRPGTEVGSYADECGAASKLFAMFYGPDGHILTAHALVGSQAPSDDLQELTRIVTTLSPTGHAPTVIPGFEVEIAFAKGSTAPIGRWIFALRYHPDGERSFWFRTEASGAGFFVQPGKLVNWGMIGDPSGLIVVGLAPDEASDVTVVAENGEVLQGHLIPVSSDELPGRVAFWVDPLEGELSAEGTMSPAEALVVRDAQGYVLERLNLP